MCIPSRTQTRCRSTVQLLCSAAILATVCGCGRAGPAYWPVRGKVTFQGKPVAVGQIRFSNPAAGIDVVESLDTDGQYAIITGDRKGLPEGQYQVAVIPKLDFSKVKCDTSGRPIPSTMPSSAERNPPNIPQKYHDPAASGLTATVKPTANTFDVDMQPAQ
jgi:predicted small lipoprotein YifL